MDPAARPGDDPPADLDEIEESEGIVGWELVDRRAADQRGEERVELVPVTQAGPEADVIVGIYHPAVGGGDQHPGVVWLGGAGGGIDGPASGLYPRLARRLASAGIASLRLDYRHPQDLEPSIIDAVIGVGFLRDEGASAIALVGHSAGGAVAISVGAILEGIATVVTLATQTYGTDLAAELAPASLLLVHGEADEILPPACSLDVRRRTDARAALELLPGAGHGFDGWEDDLDAMVLEWLGGELEPWLPEADRGDPRRRREGAGKRT